MVAQGKGHQGRSIYDQEHGLRKEQNTAIGVAVNQAAQQ